MNPMTNVKNIQKLSEQELTKGWKTSWHDQYKDSAWVFIGGLPFDLSEGDIITVFSQYGEIASLNLVRDKETGKSRGFCFLCYEDQRSTILAVDNFNSMKLLNRTIRVDHVTDYKQPKSPKRNKNGDPQEVPAEQLEPDPVVDVPIVKEEPIVKPKSKKDKSKEDSKKKSKKKQQKSSSSSDSSSSSEEQETKKKKKHKKKKNKKRKKTQTSSSVTSDSDSSESSEGSDKKRPEKSERESEQDVRVKHEKLSESRFSSNDVPRHYNSKTDRSFVGQRDSPRPRARSPGKRISPTSSDRKISISPKERQSGEACERGRDKQSPRPAWRNRERKRSFSPRDRRQLQSPRMERYQERKPGPARRRFRSPSPKGRSVSPINRRESQSPRVDRRERYQGREPDTDRKRYRSPSPKGRSVSPQDRRQLRGPRVDKKRFESPSPKNRSVGSVERKRDWSRSPRGRSHSPQEKKRSRYSDSVQPGNRRERSDSRNRSRDVGSPGPSNSGRYKRASPSRSRERFDDKNRRNK